MRPWIYPAFRLRDTLAAFVFVAVGTAIACALIAGLLALASMFAIADTNIEPLLTHPWPVPGPC